MRYLKYLDLSFNRLTELLKDDIEGAPNVETLLINNNQINNMPSNTFENMVQVTNYNFSNNPLTIFNHAELSNGILSMTPKY